MYTVLVPTHVTGKLIARFSVRELPDAEMLDPLPLSRHWLFCCVPLPGVMELDGGAPASVNSVRAFCARLYITAQALAVLVDVLNRIPTVVKSVAARLSET